MNKAQAEAEIARMQRENPLSDPRLSTMTIGQIAALAVKWLDAQGGSLHACPHCRAWPCACAVAKTL